MIPIRIHAALDGASAAALLLGPRALGWPRGLQGPLAAAGLGTAAYSLLTRYEEGSPKPLALKRHLALDAAQGAAFLAAAALLDREPRAVRLSMAGYGLFALGAALLTERREAAPSGVPRQVPLSPDAVIRAARGHKAQEIARDLAYRRLGIVNVVFLGPPGAGDRGWILVDAGLTGTASLIEAAAAERFGPGARPAAIVLTHGHFDHVGALRSLARRWDAPIYAHPLEHPYLDGRRAYPPSDPSVGGGLMATLSPLYPRAPIDVGQHLQALPEDGGVPGAPDWRWIHTPGHTPGHVSLWRESDHALVAGDAVVTTRQESVYAVAVQAPEMHGPPAYFTPDWAGAKVSARRLADLAPDTLITGHGAPMGGPLMRHALRRLAAEFDARAVPRSGLYVAGPAPLESMPLS